MKAIKLKENIYWVGGIDWNLRNFHGYLTQCGSTYNAYLIIDEKITLIDTTKYYLVDELLQRISSVIEPSKIDYIISNHTEMDHSGGLPKLMEICPNAEIIVSPAGEKGLKAHYKKNWKFKIVKTGDKLKIGKYTLDFVLTPMIHWPDNMAAYLSEEKILFSNDAFGQHIASYERFDDEYPLDMIIREAQKYYANIVLCYSGQVINALKTLANLQIDIIAPSHGIIWRNNIPEILKYYKKWSANEFDNCAAIIYDTMWNSTKILAESIQTAFENKNIKTQMFSLQHNHISDIMTDLMNAKYICVGSPTLNNNIFLTVFVFLIYMKGLVLKNRVGLAFGSFGWSGQSVDIVNDILKSCGFQMLEPIKAQYIPDKIALDNIVKNLESKL
ncbi:MAG TPA: FprA family A-type flavoprotein [bacterium]|nr:FprA family A-type flavoprotein [bacterium]